MKKWYVLRSKPRKEASAAALLSRAEIEIYFPRVAVQKGGSVLPVLTSFFPCYLFGRLDSELGEIRLARYTPGIADVVGYGRQAWPVPDDLVLAIRQRLETGQAEDGAAGFRSGDRVVIANGPFRGVEAVFDRRLSAVGRAQVLIQMVHRLCRAEVQLGQLRRAAGQGKL